MGSRTANNPKALAWVQAQTAQGRVGAATLGEAAEFGELIVLATLGSQLASAIASAGTEPFAGKVVMDATNPLDFSHGFPPRLLRERSESGGEEAQRLLPNARVVKAFNTVGTGLMYRPSLAGGPGSMFICGNDSAAKEVVAGVCRDFGWDAVDIGGIDAAGCLEAAAVIWIRLWLPSRCRR